MSADRAALSDTVLGVLRSIAPEVEPGAIAPAGPLRHQVDLDSMDWLNFLVGLHARLGVSIPEVDYAQLVTLDNVLDYLLARLPQAAG
jgi:acyl carrier protein